LSKLKRDCIVCGKPIKFRRDNLSALTCSDKCSYKHKIELTKVFQKDKYKKFKTKIRCVICGKNIKGKDYGSNFTCLQCNLKEVERGRKRIGAIEKRFEIKNCVVCGEDIIDRISLCKYCLRCVKELNRLYHKYGLKFKEGIKYLKGEIPIIRRRKNKPFVL